jgi:N-acetyl-anhydromuramoyl-L-alanine amidase
VISVDGWLANVAQCPSPNVNQRPLGQEINLLVIHNISLPPGEFGGGFVTAFFCNQLDTSLHPYFKTIGDLKVSAHLFIDRMGCITQCVAFTERAWHAGVSVFNAVENCNDYSIGIEMEGCDNIAYTNEQYTALVEVTRQLWIAYPKITLDRIVGHSDIAPQRKTDPGSAFDWARYHFLLTSE